MERQESQPEDQRAIVSDLVVSGVGPGAGLEKVPIPSGDSDFDEIALVRFSAKDWDDLARLTDKQRRFVLEYPRDYNGTAAAARAGYQGGDNALAVRSSLLLRHPVAGELIRKLCSATADEIGLTREWVLRQLEDVAVAARKGAPKFVGKDGVIAKDEDGNVVYEWSPQGAAKALELIARLRGDMIERRQVDVRTVAITINDVEMEDLR